MNKLKCSAIMAFILLGFITTIAQDKYKLINSSVRFFSSTPVEDIEAENKASLGVLDTKTGNFSVRVPITEFKFKSTLMEDHFNENYMESSKYPKADFKGYIKNIKEVYFTKEGNYPITIEGNLTIHGTTQKVSSNGNLQIEEGKSIISGEFSVKIKDYGIKGLYIGDKIAPEAKIKVNCIYQN